jgi:hypothetical protein
MDFQQMNSAICKTGAIDIEIEILIDQHLLGSSYAPSQLANARIAHNIHHPTYRPPKVGHLRLDHSYIPVDLHNFHTSPLTMPV